MKLLIQHGDDWLSFENPVEVLTARTPDEVFQCLEKVEQSGLWAAGFVSYEAAGAFDDALKTYTPGNLPLLQFGLFQTLEKIKPESHGEYSLGEWKPSVSRGEYIEAIAEIKEHIAAGDTYQVNHTFRLNADFEGDPFAFFCDLISAQQGGYSAFIETDGFAICSASPELFFELKDGVIISRPMKGTRARGRTFSNDWKQREALRNSAKDRAENIMIVDMIRNDIGRIADPGSVETVSRFDVEKYPTVWQLTSTVTGKVKSPSRLATSNVWKNLFPCASITGAPKVKTMEIIQGLEKSPRGVYTGSIGFIDPEGNAQFNVAIRTAVIQGGEAEYGIGGGVVWDSDADAEYDEAMSKAAILVNKQSEFRIMEALLYDPEEGLFLLDRHLKRLGDSAEYFDFRVDVEPIRRHLCCLEFSVPMKIRLFLDRNGSFECLHEEVVGDAAAWQVRIASEPVDLKNVFLYHKTTNRSVYEKAKGEFPEADDVILYNERGEVTESCRANVVLELDGRKVTPPVSCGLLAGTFRDELLACGDIEERVVMLEELERADVIWLINSVRKWRRGVLRGGHA